MTTIAIVEDNANLRVALQKVVESSPELSVACICPTGEEALKMIPAIQPDIILMDLQLPGIDGVETIRCLKAQLPKLQFIVLTVYRDYDRIYSALRAGAVGYLLKRSSPDEILNAIIQVREGGAPMTSEIARRLVETFHREEAPPRTVSGEASNLSPREREILELLGQGLANKEIADRLNLSVETIRARLKGIYEKLHVHSRTEAALKYHDLLGQGQKE